MAFDFNSSSGSAFDDLSKKQTPDSSKGEFGNVGGDRKSPSSKRGFSFPGRGDSGESKEMHCSNRSGTSTPSVGGRGLDLPQWAGKGIKSGKTAGDVPWRAIIYLALAIVVVVLLVVFWDVIMKMILNILSIAIIVVVLLVVLRLLFPRRR